VGTLTENRNSYLDQVVAQQEQLESDLRAKGRISASYSAKPAAPGAPAQAAFGSAAGAGPAAAPTRGLGGGAERPAANGVEVRITGFGRRKTVLVPPNAYVVHTRRGQAEPRHVGLGVSFRYNPATDTFLVVPGAMQTILLNAFCICRELQGVLVQAYVQWMIQDFATAYRKLDFSDPMDPMRLVNLQLREQAEAAIKDKVATMSVHEVLSDRQPIIEELTARLRAVAEGEGDSAQALGLRIVTVQIREAVVSSKTLWENLQKPFRVEQARLAALAELAADGAVTESRMTEARKQESRRLADERELGSLRAANQAQEFDRETGEQARRDAVVQENARRSAEAAQETRLHALNLERERHEQESAMARLRLAEEQEINAMRLRDQLAAQRFRTDTEHAAQLLDLERERLRAEIANARSAASLQADLISALPAVVEKFPSPAEYKSVTIGGTENAPLAGLLAQLSAVVNTLKT
jgi:flotillin